MVKLLEAVAAVGLALWRAYVPSDQGRRLAKARDEDGEEGVRETRDCQRGGQGQGQKVGQPRTGRRARLSRCACATR